MADIASLLASFASAFTQHTRQLTLQLGNDLQQQLGLLPLALDANDRSDDHGIAGRHFEHLTRELTPVGQHVSAKHGHFHALESRWFRTRGSGDRLGDGEVVAKHCRAAKSMISR